MRPPKVFISYSWDSPAHKQWTCMLATRLRDGGVDVIFDQWHLKYGDPLPEFMDKGIRESDYVLIVCTPKYKAKSDGRMGGVGYEGAIIQGDVLARSNHRKYIPVLREGSQLDSLPSALFGKYYVSLHDLSFQQNFSSLLDHLRNFTVSTSEGSNVNVNVEGPLATRLIISDEFRIIQTNLRAHSIGFGWNNILAASNELEVTGFDLRTCGKSWSFWHPITTRDKVTNSEVYFTPDGETLAVINTMDRPSGITNACFYEARSQKYFHSSSSRVVGVGEHFYATTDYYGHRLQVVDMYKPAKSIAEVTIENPPSSIAFSSKMMMATTHKSDIAIWDLSNGSRIIGIPFTGNASTTFSSDGNFLAVYNNGLQIWNTQTWSMVGFIGDQDQRYRSSGFVMYKHFNLAATKTADNDDNFVDAEFLDTRHTISIWDVGSGVQRISTTVEGRVGEMQFSPDGKTLAWCEDRVIRLWRFDR